MEEITPTLVSWASQLDPETREQAIASATMPFIYPHVALMPDAHLGFGVAVGSVIPTSGAIMPAAVGVDIGCGMIALRTQFTHSDLPDNPGLVRRAIEHAVPLSAGVYNTAVTRDHTRARIAELEEHADRAGFDPAAYGRNWRLQVGTLGSGNHFVELSVDEVDRVWLFLHSGSRGVGNKLATHHIRIAQQRCANQHLRLPNRDLAYLEEGTDAFDAYITQMRWAQHFALLNREEMMDRVVAAFEHWVNASVRREEQINCHHNYTESETHFGARVWVSRKGAISARRGELGVVPGSMGTPSYVVAGKGNEMALNSCPHGAGRLYSRTAARKRFTHAQLREAMRGIEYRDTDAFLDEIPMAYKDIDQVMLDAADLVEVRHTLRQLVNVKGD
jgi:tRNA-splicing ligase RtcB